MDGEANAKLRAVVRAKWNEWNANKRENAILWDFIEVERNNLLKEYKFGVEPELEYLVDDKGEILTTEEGDPFAMEEEFFRLSHVGFEHREGRDVIEEAIEWWRKQLDAIEGVPNPSA